MKKLKNEQGVTILMALLLVLTAAVVSAVILSAALSAARRVNGDRTAQQNYLAVSSAGGARTRQHRPDAVYRDYHHDLRMGRGERELSANRQLLHREAADRLDGRLAHGRRAEPAAAPIPSPSRCRMKRSPPVKASFSMTGRGTGSGGYDIRIAFSLADAGDADDCRMTLRLSGSVSESTDVYANTAGWSRIDELTITWSNPKITKGAGGERMKKRRSKAGETLVETLVSVLIAALAFALLSTAAVTAARINAAAREDVSFRYTAEQGKTGDRNG